MKKLFIALLATLVVGAASADTYVLVFRPSSNTTPDPDLGQYHATLIARWGTTRKVVTMSPADAGVLRQHPQVRYLQRISDTAGSSPSAVRAIASESLRLAPEVQAAPPDWSTGSYQYDANGDIRALNDDSKATNHRYVYDELDRLVTASVQDAATPTINKSFFNYAYDGFGNRTSRNDEHNNLLPTAAEATTNRLSAARYGYNAVGSLVTDGSHHYKHDAAAMLSETDISGTLNSFAIYGPDDERVALCTGSECKWTIRGAGQKIRRELESDTLLVNAAPSHWLWVEDYVYRADTAVASQREDREGGRAFLHQDHLGSTRLITGSGGQQLASLEFEPFGMELVPTTYETQKLGFERNEPIRFTGHQRDFEGPNYTDGDPYLDYMHARYYSALGGRFLSVDPSWDSADSDRLQTWNRYSYVENNPFNKTDPDGKCPACLGAGIGAAAGFIGEVWRQGFGADAPVDWKKAGAAAAGGAVSGALAGATMGIGVIAESTGGAALAYAMVVNGSANIVGGAVQRRLNGETSLDGKQILIDGAVGAGSGAIGHGIAKLVKGEVPTLVKQVERSAEAARKGGGYGAAASAHGAAARILRINARAAVMDTVASAKMSNIIAPKVQDSIEKKKPSQKR